MSNMLEIPGLLLVVGLVFLGVLLVAALSSVRRLQSELAAVSEHAPAAIAHVAKRGDGLKYTHVNSKYAALYGFTQKDVIGNQPKNVLGDEIFNRAKPNMDRAIAGENVVFDLEFKGRTLEVTYAPDHEAPGFIGVIQDVTELRKLQAKA